MRRREAVARILTFLDEIGIPHRPVAKGPDGFLSAIRIVDGTLEIDVRRVHPADILHEAGHLAVLPSDYRIQAQADIDDLVERMCGEAVVRYEIDSPELRAVMQSGEPESTAWAYAAGMHLGLGPRQIIDNQHYDGGGHDVRVGLLIRCHAGINGLVAGGMCASVRSYPALTRWTQI